MESRSGGKTEDAVDFGPLLRPRLIEAIEECAALTILRGPSGLGKSTLVEQWAAAAAARGVDVFHVSEFGHLQGAEGAWRAILDAIGGCGQTPRPAGCAEARESVAELLDARTSPLALVVTLPERSSKSSGLEAVLTELAGRFPQVRIVATARTREVFRDSAEIVPGCREIDAEELLFTAPELEQLCRLWGLPLPAPAVADVNEYLGGIPLLIRAAAPALGKLATSVTWTDTVPLGPSWAPLQTAVELWIDGATACVSRPELAAGLLTLAAVLERVDEGTVAAVLSDFDAEEVGSHALDLGLLADGATAPGAARTWRAVPAVRSVLVDRLREERLAGAPEILGGLTAHLVASGDPSSAIRCLMTAGDWDRLLPVLRDNFAALLDSDVQLIKDALEGLPAAVARRDPIIEMGRTMFAGLDAGIASAVASDSGGSELVDKSGKKLDLPDLLSSETVWSIILRLAGRFLESAVVAERAADRVRDSAEEEFGAIKSYLPVMRVQWAINHQLAAKIDLAQEELRHSLSEGRSSGIDFVAKNAAGILAMNDAMRGETTRARSWLTVESRYPDTPGWLEDRVRIPGLVSRVQIAIDSMDLERAETDLDVLGMPEDSEELWVAVISAHVSVERARGRTQVALDLVDWACWNYKRWCPPQSFADITLKVMHAELYTALGRGNEALAHLGTLHETLPAVQARVGLVHLLSGDAHATLTGLADFSGAACCPRPFVEMLLIAAAAHALLGEHDRAKTFLQRAAATSRKTGAVMPLLSLPRVHREKLLDTGIVDAELAAVWRRFSAIDLYPRDITLVALSDREHAVLRLAAEGMGRRVLAESLFVSENTVKTHLRSIYKKLNVTNRTDAIVAAQRLGLI